MALVSIRDFEKKAIEVLPKFHSTYYNHGSVQMTSLNNNQESFQRLHLRPKCLQDVSKIDISTQILGLDVSMPVGIAPTAFHGMGNPNGELATVRAAEKAGVVFTQSNLSNFSIKEVAEAAPSAMKWAQLYIFKDRNITEQTVQMAELNGYKALVLTVDSPCYGSLSYSTKNLDNFEPDPVLFRIGTVTAIDPSTPEPVPLDASVKWEDVKWLVGYSKLPVIAKGILRPDDALRAIEAGCKAIWISNHGGRQLDTTPAPIEVLPEISMAVDGKVPLFVDGGFRLGTDIIKALALGADMVFLGRPILWGLSVQGEVGVEEVLRLVKEELVTAMMLCGTPTINLITTDIVRHESVAC